ncbi:MAG: hypothetical protein M5U08_20270 [Burkholderiales bacterium]|nr:hypothetical protein [Burkholderiales bacterium]
MATSIATASFTLPALSPSHCAVNATSVASVFNWSLPVSPARDTRLAACSRNAATLG